MESILFVPTVSGTEWLTGLFPGRGPAEMPVAGRRMIDYGLEGAQKAGAALVEVLDWNWTERLEKYFSDPTRTGSAVFYEKGTGEPPRGLDDLNGLPTPLTQSMEDGIVVVWGPSVAFDLNLMAMSEPVSPEECAHTPIGFYRREKGQWVRRLPRMLAVTNVKRWHELNFAVLHDPCFFTLPGYSAEKGVYLGRNVVMERGTEAKAPVLIQDDVWCARNVRLDGDVVIGRGSVVGEGARLVRTVVGDDTYIGDGLELDGKIVIGRRIIDVETGAWTDIEDKGVAHRLRTAESGWIGKVWRFILGTSRGRRV